MLFLFFASAYHSKTMNRLYMTKTYDRISREVLWKALEKKGVWVVYIRAIKDMYVHWKRPVIS